MKQKKALLAGLIFSLLTGVLAAETANPVHIQTEKKADGSIAFFADNDRLVPSWVHLEFKTLENLNSDQPLPLELVLAANSKHTPLLTLTPVPKKATKYSYNWTSVMGDPVNTHPDPNYTYIFPFDHAARFKLVQGFHGNFTHKGDEEFALDFNLPEGTRVTAARDGLVVAIKNDGVAHGVTPEFGKDGNFVRVWHADGTMASYFHFKTGGVAVTEGSMVKTGDLLGYSGNTGLSSGPHLHFDLRVPRTSGKSMSIPMRFLGLDGLPVDPVEGVFYSSFHPGSPAFTVVDGSALTPATYADYAGKPLHDGKVETHWEKIDDTYIMYFSNGLKSNLTADVTMELTNLGSVLNLPITVKAPAQTEVFLTLLRPVVQGGAYSFKTHFTYKKIP